MRLAREIEKNGMAAGDSFINAIHSLIRTKGLMNIIESGSYMGLGTTKAIKDAITGGELVYSIEVNPQFHRMAMNNNKGSGIKFLKGLSIAKSDLPVSFTFDVPDHVIIDHLEKDMVKNYSKEVNFVGVDNLLGYALGQMSNEPDLVVLDSAGHLGLIEFRYLMARVKGDFYLALDDIKHVKHYETFEYIKQHTEQFEVVYHTEEKFGSAIIRVSVL